MSDRHVYRPPTDPVKLALGSEELKALALPLPLPSERPLSHERPDDP